MGDYQDLSVKKLTELQDYSEGDKLTMLVQGQSVSQDGTVSESALLQHVASIDSKLSIPDATKTSKGIVQVGDGIDVNEGVISLAPAIRPGTAEMTYQGIPIPYQTATVENIINPISVNGMVVINNNEASGQGSHAEGISTSSKGIASHSEGWGCQSSGDAAHAEGKNTVADNDFAHSEGLETAANGKQSHAEGNSTIAVGNFSHAEGTSSTANGEASHAEGHTCLANSANAHAEGNNTQAGGNNSHAEGDNTEASGNNSHAEGDHCVATGNNSHANGKGIYLNALSQTGIGEYNAVDTNGSKTTRSTHAFIIGNGNSPTARSNAHTVTWEGTAWYAGDITCDAVQGNHDNLYSMRAMGAVVASTPSMEYGTSNSVSVAANAHTLVDITFGTAKTEAPIVFTSVQHATAGVNLICTVQSVTNQQASLCVTNLGTTDLGNITIDWLAISGR